MSDGISIGLPVYNGGHLLDRALTSLRSQTEQDLEIVVSDNGSTDDTPVVLARHAAGDPRIVVHRFERTVGVLDNFAEVVERATRTHFMWAAHDDTWDPDHVERLVAHHRADATVAVAAGVPHVIDGEGLVLRSLPEALELGGGQRAERLARFLEQPEPLGKANLIYGVFRRDVLTAVDPRRFWHADRRRVDMHLVFAALAHGRAVVDPGVRFLKGETPAPRGGPLESVARIARSGWAVNRWLRAYGPIIDELDLSPDEAARLHRVVRRRRASLLGDAVRRVVAAQR